MPVIFKLNTSVISKAVVMAILLFKSFDIASILLSSKIKFMAFSGSSLQQSKTLQSYLELFLIELQCGHDKNKFSQSNFKSLRVPFLCGFKCSICISVSFPKLQI